MRSFTFITLSNAVSVEVPVLVMPTKLPLDMWKLLRYGGGPIPGAPAGWTVQLKMMEGAMYYSIHRGTSIIGVGAVVARQAQAQLMWGLLEELHLKTYEVMSDLVGGEINDMWLGNPSQPVAAPWVGLVFQPDMLVNEDALQWLFTFVNSLGLCSLVVLLKC